MRNVTQILVVLAPFVFQVFVREIRTDTSTSTGIATASI